MGRSVKSLALLILAGLVMLPGCSKLQARDELNKGVHAFKVGAFEKSVEHFKRATELDPDFINARLYLATAYAAQFFQAPSEENRKKAEAAIVEYQKVLEIDRSNATALAYIAQLYFGMAGTVAATSSKWNEAHDLFLKSKEYRQRLIEVEPQNPEHYYSVGVIDWTLTYRPRMQLRSDLKLPKSETPIPPKNRRELADQNAPLVEEGITVLTRAIDINPKYLDAIAYLQLMYREKADLAETPRDRDALLEQADEWYERYEQVRQEMQKAPAPAPSS